jgi:predicted amidohydrolase YtcJ
MKFKLFYLWTICLISIVTAGERLNEQADLLLYNGKIWTMSPNQPEVEALAVRDGRIIEIGSNAELAKYKDVEHRLNLEGKRVLPGLIESHAHYMKLGYQRLKLPLQQARNWAEIVQMVAEEAAKKKPGEWIQGRGWHQEKWNETAAQLVEGYPVNNQLSAVAPQNPVYLEHASGHAIIVNERAMRIAGISEESTDPPGGRILRKSDGTLTGVFLENAEDLVYFPMTAQLNNRAPEVIQAEKENVFALAALACLEKGITTFHDAGAKFKRIKFYKTMIDRGQSPVRLWVMVRDTLPMLHQKLKDTRIIGYADDHLTVRAVKVYMDGALGSHGAWLLEPYTDQQDQLGLNTTPLDIIEETAELAIQNDFQVCTHAIGDRGNREILNIYERVFEKYPQQKNLRWRIEHAQHLHPQDIPRFAELGVIAAMQSNHCTSDGPWVPLRLGDKRSAEGAYVWQSLLKSGAVICNGTDAPVEDVNPFLNMVSALTRRMSNGEHFYPQEKMTRDQLLRSYTTDAAYTGFEENIKGMLIPGQLADLVVVSDDIVQMDEENIDDTTVLFTIIGGKIVYKKP